MFIQKVCFHLKMFIFSIFWKYIFLMKTLYIMFIKSVNSENKISYAYMCITRSERVCIKGSIKREWLFTICVTFSLSNSLDIRLLCLIICYLCFWFVFKILFSSILCVLYFYFVPYCTTISVYYLHVHVFMCINIYTHGHIAQCIKK